MCIRDRHIIECSYASKISQKDLAADLGVSAEYFSYLFSRDVGDNFSRFLRRYRIEKAQEMCIRDSSRFGLNFCYGMARNPVFMRKYKDSKINIKFNEN